MFQVHDIYDEARKIIGTCDEVKFFRWLGDAVSLIANKGEFEGWKGYLDICTGSDGKCVALPREVENILAVNIGGHPTLALDQLFSFHLNGPGDCCQSCSWNWQDQGGFHSTYRDIVIPSKLVAYLQTAADNGKKLIVYGFDSSGNRLRHQEGGQWLDGYRVPTVFGYAIPDSGAPTIARISHVAKDDTVGTVRLSTIDDSGATGTLLAVYEPDERVPNYRRIKLGRTCGWVRIAYRKTNPVFTSRYDRVPLKSRIGYLLAIRSLKYYADVDLPAAHAFEADAIRMEMEAQQMSEPPTYHPIQVIDLNNPNSGGDFDIR